MITLRPYQSEAIRLTHEAMLRVNRVCLCAPTGSGKRVLACWWATGIAKRGKRLMVVTDRRILVDQMAAECKQHGIEYGIRMGDSPRNDEALVQICSIQTLKVRKWKDNPAADWIICDESHKDPIGYQKLLGHYNGVKFVGLTATPVGADGKKLSIVDEVVEPIRNSELIRQGYLLPVECLTPFEPNVKGVKVSGGEYNQSDLGQRIKKCVVFANVFKWWEKYDHLQTICFSPGVDFAYGLAEQFKDRGYSAEVIEAGTNKQDRRDIFTDFKSGAIRVLVSVDVLREGFDAPESNCGIDLQPNKQLRTYWQKIGRIKRPHEGTDKAVWLDFAGNFWRHLHPDDDPDWPTGDETTQELVERKKKPKEPGEPKQWSCPNCAYALSPWEKIRDGKCPGCGKPIGKSIRRVVFENGRMKSVSAKDRKKKKEDTNMSIWFQSLYPCIHNGLSVHQAAMFYHKRTGRWPDQDLNLSGRMALPRKGSSDWKRPARALYGFLVKR